MISEALACRLDTAPDLCVVECASAGDPGLAETVRSLRPDIILIEVEPLDLAVGEVVRELIAACPTAQVVVLGGTPSTAEVVEAARAGADAWVSRNQGADELENVIRAVCDGRSCFPPEVFGAILRALRADITTAREHGDTLAVLSPREREVMASMAEGKLGRQIAKELMISADTVRTHIRNILSKLDARSSLEAVSIARSAGLRPSGQTDARGRPPMALEPRPLELRRR